MCFFPMFPTVQLSMINDYTFKFSLDVSLLIIYHVLLCRVCYNLMVLKVVVEADMNGVEGMTETEKETGIGTGTVTGIAGGLTVETETGGK